MREERRRIVREDPASVGSEETNVIREEPTTVLRDEPTTVVRERRPSRVVADRDNFLGPLLAVIGILALLALVIWFFANGPGNSSDVTDGGGTRIQNTDADTRNEGDAGSTNQESTGDGAGANSGTGTEAGTDAGAEAGTDSGTGTDAGTGQPTP